MTTKTYQQATNQSPHDDSQRPKSEPSFSHKARTYVVSDVRSQVAGLDTNPKYLERGFVALAAGIGRSHGLGFQKVMNNEQQQKGGCEWKDHNSRHDVSTSKHKNVVLVVSILFLM